MVREADTPVVDGVSVLAAEEYVEGSVTKVLDGSLGVDGIVEVASVVVVVSATPVEVSVTRVWDDSPSEPVTDSEVVCGTKSKVEMEVGGTIGEDWMEAGASKGEDGMEEDEAGRVGVMSEDVGLTPVEILVRVSLYFNDLLVRSSGFVTSARSGLDTAFFPLSSGFNS